MIFLAMRKTTARGNLSMISTDYPVDSCGDACRRLHVISIPGVPRPCVYNKRNSPGNVPPSGTETVPVVFYCVIVRQKKNPSFLAFERFRQNDRSRQHQCSRRRPLRACNAARKPRAVKHLTDRGDNVDEYGQRRVVRHTRPSKTRYYETVSVSDVFRPTREHNNRICMTVSRKNVISRAPAASFF